jgi:hypothetical protein
MPIHLLYQIHRRVIAHICPSCNLFSNAKHYTMQKPKIAPSYEAKYLTVLWLSTQLMIKASISLTIWNASLHFKIVFTGKPFLIYTVHSRGQVFQKPREQHITVISQVVFSTETTCEKIILSIKVYLVFYLTIATLLPIYW